MQNHPEHNDETKPTGRNRGRLVAVAAVVAFILLLVVLHLTGAIGAKSH